MIRTYSAETLLSLMAPAHHQPSNLAARGDRTGAGLRMTLVGGLVATVAPGPLETEARFLKVELENLAQALGALRECRRFEQPLLL
jgi:hypothetical protein